MIPVEARGAWRELEVRLRPYIARRVPSSDIDDVVQETFVRIHKGLPTLEDHQRFGAWVYQIARTTIADQARHRARHLRAAEPNRDVAEEEAPHSEDSLVGELAQCVALFVARLPSPYREAITLTELQGLTQKDAAEMLGISLSGMKSRVQRGRERIRQMFEECCEISVDGRGRVTECVPRGAAEVSADCAGAPSAPARGE